MPRHVAAGYETPAVRHQKETRNAFACQALQRDVWRTKKKRVTVVFGTVGQTVGERKAAFLMNMGFLQTLHIYRTWFTSWLSHVVSWILLFRWFASGIYLARGNPFQINSWEPEHRIRIMELIEKMGSNHGKLGHPPFPIRLILKSDHDAAKLMSFFF